MGLLMQPLLKQLRMKGTAHESQEMESSLFGVRLHLIMGGPDPSLSGLGEPGPFTTLPSLLEGAPWTSQQELTQEDGRGRGLCWRR